MTAKPTYFEGVSIGFLHECERMGNLLVVIHAQCRTENFSLLTSAAPVLANGKKGAIARNGQIRTTGIPSRQFGQTLTCGEGRDRDRCGVGQMVSIWKKAELGLILMILCFFLARSLFGFATNSSDCGEVSL